MTQDGTRMARVQMNLPQGSIDRLDDLVRRTESSSYAEVMRNALRLYDVAVGEVESGRGLFIRRGDEYEPMIALVGR